ncbi:MAG: NUDIX hydrolase, partial [bacterium]|nr:NUDIX hydrolase [bacterium]
KEVKEECGLDLKPSLILIKEKAIGRPDGQTSKSLSFLCSAENPNEIVIDRRDFTDFVWVDLAGLKKLNHVGIEAEFIKTKRIYDSGCDLSIFSIDTDQVDFREKQN